MSASYDVFDSFPHTRDVVRSILDCEAYGLGLQLYVVAGGRVALNVALGSAGTGRPMTTRLAHPCACLGKPLLALAVLALADEGRLGLDDPLNDHIPSDRLPSSIANARLTARIVLNHATNLRSPDGGGFRLTPPTMFAEFFMTAAVSDGVGYSDFVGWRLLELLIESVVAVDAASHLSRALLLPLGIESSVALSPKAATNLFKAGHLDVPVGGLPMRRYTFLGQLTWEWFRFVTPALGAFVSAQAMGTLMGCLLDVLMQRPTPMTGPSRNTLQEALAAGRGPMWDNALHRVCDFAGGLMKDVNQHRIATLASNESYGQVAGWYPTAAVADHSYDLAFAFYLNGVVTDLNELCLVRSSISDAIYRDIGASRG